MNRQPEVEPTDDVTVVLMFAAMAAQMVQHFLYYARGFVYYDHIVMIWNIQMTKRIVH